jgi:hypothetical protein
MNAPLSIVPDPTALPTIAAALLVAAAVFHVGLCIAFDPSEQRVRRLGLGVMTAGAFGFVAVIILVAR